jgi:hypothetical protein
MAKSGERILEAAAQYAKLTDDGSPEYSDQVRILSDDVEKAVKEILNENMGRALRGIS